MNRYLSLSLALALAGCSGAKIPSTEDFSSLDGADAKSDAFSRRMKIVGALHYGDSSADVSYHNPPRYRAFTFDGAKDDQVDIWVRSPDGSGDSMGWLLDAKFKTVASNDDADSSTTDSHLTATLGAAGTFYIVFRDYYLGDATFNVTLGGTPASNFFSCNLDSDCVAIQKAECCPHGDKIAVNVNQVDAYRAANICLTRGILCPLFIILDQRVSECNFQTHQCEMIDPAAQHCGGFIYPNHQCSPGYECRLSRIPDAGGTCVKKQCVQNVQCTTFGHWDSTACQCVDNPHCGGIAARPCTDPRWPNCIDDPRDSCDPANGGADCGGICVP